MDSNSRHAKGCRGEKCLWQFARESTLANWFCKDVATGSPEVSQVPPGPPIYEPHESGVFKLKPSGLEYSTRKKSVEVRKATNPPFERAQTDYLSEICL